jgi:hypothetical protein
MLIVPVSVGLVKFKSIINRVSIKLWQELARMYSLSCHDSALWPNRTYFVSTREWWQMFIFLMLPWIVLSIRYQRHCTYHPSLSNLRFDRARQSSRPTNELVKQRVTALKAVGSQYTRERQPSRRRCLGSRSSGSSKNTRTITKRHTRNHFAMLRSRGVSLAKAEENVLVPRVKPRNIRVKLRSRLHFFV